MSWQSRTCCFELKFSHALMLRLVCWNTRKILSCFLGVSSIHLQVAGKLREGTYKTFAGGVFFMCCEDIWPWQDVPCTCAAYVPTRQWWQFQLISSIIIRCSPLPQLLHSFPLHYYMEECHLHMCPHVQHLRTQPLLVKASIILNIIADARFLFSAPPV